MSEWWTYSLSDFLMFSPRTYFRLFELYNRGIWPAQLAALLLGAAIAVWLSRLRRRGDRVATSGGRAVAAALAAGWLWVAWFFFVRRFATISTGGIWFARGFAVEGLLLAWTAASGLRRAPATEARFQPGSWVFLYAWMFQPLIGPVLGRAWTQVEIFGVAPDPTALGTMGLVLVFPGRTRWELLLIPTLWCAVTGATQWTMRSPDALATPLVALLTLILAARRRRARPAGS